MIVFTCSVCQKKLSIPDDLVGKKVKCPGCLQVTVVLPQAAKAAVSSEETCTMPPLSRADLPTPAATDKASEQTAQRSSASDATEGSKPDSGQNPNLTDFLAPPQANDELGRLGDYRILQILGHGGMGVVFLGEDPRLNRKVAIKAMLPHLALSKLCQQRFLLEARAAAALTHDNIVAIHHVGEDRGAPYIVMPLLKGEPLDARLRRAERVPLTEVLRIGREIARALAAAHASSLIHRDIKPANIWLEAPEGRVKILDFGLARAAQQDSGLTQQGAIIGTPAYMAPEQGRGETVDARCDLFSLGVVLYRLCTGEQPFQGKDTVSTLMSVALDNPEPPIRRNTELPAELSDLVMKLLAKDPAQRIGTAEEVIQTLVMLENQLRKGTAPNLVGAATPTPKNSSEKLAAVTKSYAKPAERPASAKTDPTTSARKSRPRLVLAACALFLGLVLLGGGVLAYQLFLRTSNGTLVVEADGDADVRFQQGKLRIHDPTGKLLYVLKPSEKNKTLPPGQYLIEVAGVDGLKLDTTKFEMTKNGEVKIRVTLKPPVLAPPGPDKDSGPAKGKIEPVKPLPPAVAEKGVHDFAEIHDADEKRFDLWIAKMKKDGFRPVRLTVQTVENSPRYTAVALKDDKNFPWEFTRMDEKERGLADKQWKRKFQAVAQALFHDQGTMREVFLWVKDPSLDNSGVWVGPPPFIESKVRAARKAKDRLLSRCGIFDDNDLEFGIIIEEADGVPWQESYNLVFGDLKSYVEQHKADGWRPDHFCYYGVGAKRRFGAILIQDANKIDWDTSWSLTLAEYDKELSTRKAKGFRPLTALGHEDHTGAQRFSVIWIRYRGGEELRVPPAEQRKVKAPAYKNPLGMEFALVPKGKAWLGGGAGKEGTTAANIPQDFYLGIYEVTQQEWEKVMGIKHTFHFSRQGEGKDALADITDDELKRFPVENVSWNECQLFLKKLNELDKQPGWEYRLPTEEEWEYACRGGPGDKFQSAFDFYLEQPTNILLTSQANFDHEKGLKRTCKVGSYSPNKLGLHDMHGNVAELTHDAQPELDAAGNPKRNERGGGWTNSGDECQATGRFGRSPTERFRDFGLRVARVPVPRRD